MFHFTGFVADPQERYDLAWYFIYFVAADVAFNILFLFYHIGRKIYVAARLMFLKRRLKKEANRKVHEKGQKMGEVVQTESA